jgi:hypothetical protein
MRPSAIERQIEQVSDIPKICPRCHLSIRTHIERDGEEVCTGKPYTIRVRRPATTGRKLTGTERNAELPRPVLDFAASVARKHGLRLHEILARPAGGKRDPSVVRARHELWSVVRASWGLSLPATGRLFRVDHTSVMHAEHAYETRKAFIAGGRCDARPSQGQGPSGILVAPEQTLAEELHEAWMEALREEAHEP